jgi:hypothetical protein
VHSHKQPCTFNKLQKFSYWCQVCFNFAMSSVFYLPKLVQKSHTKWVCSEYRMLNDHISCAWHFHGAPPHFVFPAYLKFDSHFPGWQIGYGRPAEWPVLSPDLTARDAGLHSECADLNQWHLITDFRYFLWSSFYLKEKCWMCLAGCSKWQSIGFKMVQE